jgi:hypothetical protein
VMAQQLFYALCASQSLHAVSFWSDKNLITLDS